MRIAATGRLAVIWNMTRRFVTILCMARREKFGYEGRVGVKRPAEGYGQTVASQEHRGGYVL